MNVEALIDLQSAGIVLGGTVLATLLRCGWDDTAAFVRLSARLVRPGFRFEQARGRLAPQIAAIQRNGVHCAPEVACGDVRTAAVLDALIRQRSLSACVAAHRACQTAQIELRHQALRLLSVAAELAPVFGLAGTLVALTQIAGGDAAQASLTAAVGTAVLTTLYGLLTAHLLLLPLARLLERQGEREELERQRLIDWLVDQLRDTLPTPGKPRFATRLVAARTECAA